MLDELAAQPAQLRPEFQSLSPADLLQHFRERSTPRFFSGLANADAIVGRQRQLFPEETERLIKSARSIVREHRWPLLGLGEKEFGKSIDWRRDPLSGRIWPLGYHADIPLWHNDGSDIRVLWELNRLGHLITLGRAYALTKEESFAAEFFAQLESWTKQNPVGRGANWACAMEVALRAMNLLAAFSLFRNSGSFDEARMAALLTMLDQHGAHIRRNLEFSHLATSNHYLSDVAGLLWLGVVLPELSAAAEWRSWALPELLNELDKQVLPDGADYEGSTGYHRFVLELFLYSFLLCRLNEMPIAESYWRKLAAMLLYLRAILRPDGRAPLIGDTDGGQVMPIVSRSADDHSYLLALGAAIFKDEQFNVGQTLPLPELLWVFGQTGLGETGLGEMGLGEMGLRDYESVGTAASSSALTQSQAFPDAGTYVLRHEDLFLLLNANGARKGRPSSHLHNDLLSVEVSAGGRAFIVDPGTYVYTADLRERQLFRSSAYHSSVRIDDEEQQTITAEAPFVTGAEAAARVLLWESTAARDRVVAEHSGYERLAQPVTHRRAITFDKANRWWLIEDELIGTGEHQVATRFHFDAELEVQEFGGNSVVARDRRSGVCLVVVSVDLAPAVELEAQFTSRHYGSKVASVSACWKTTITEARKFRWAIVPVRAGEDPNERWRLCEAKVLEV